MSTDMNGVEHAQKSGGKWRGHRALSATSPGEGRAVIYCRVSTQEQVDNFSLSSQEKACRKFCAQNGFVVDKVFVEEGESAKTVKRTQFQKMLTYCCENKGRVSMLVVYSFSRFARNSLDHQVTKFTLLKFGVNLRSVTETTDDSPLGKFSETLAAAIAQLDNDQRSERTVVGMQTAIAAGRWPFKPPLGYLRGNKAGSSIILDPERGPLLAAAFAQMSTGLHTQAQVVETLNRRGFRTHKGKPLTVQTFNNLLRKPVYAGLIHVEKWGEPVLGDFEPLVGKEVFDAVQAVLSGKRHKVAPSLRNHPAFPLRQFVRCGSCHRFLTGSFSTGRHGKRYPYYHCQNVKCKAVTIPTQALESAFTALLERLQPKPEYVRLFKEIILEVWRQRQKESLAAASAVQRKVEELEARLERLHEAFLHERSISQETYRAQELKTKEALMLARMELQDAKATECDVEGVLAFAEVVLSKAARLWLESASDQKQRFQRILFPQGVEFLAGEYGTATTSPLFKLLQPLAVEKSELATLRGFEPRLPP
jgi:site-specific DNA recombinase